MKADKPGCKSERKKEAVLVGVRRVGVSQGPSFMPIEESDADKLA